MLQKFFLSLTSLIVLAIGTWSLAQPAATISTPAPDTENREAEIERPEHPTVYVTDLHCQHCARRLARKLFTVPGVMKVRAYVKDDMAIVIPQKDKTIAPLALWEAAEAAKFKVVKIETPDETFEAKPVELAETGKRGISTPAQR